MNKREQQCAVLFVLISCAKKKKYLNLKTEFEIIKNKNKQINNKVHGKKGS